MIDDRTKDFFNTLNKALGLPLDFDWQNDTEEITVEEANKLLDEYIENNK